MVGEVLVGRTRQTDDLDSTEVTPRIGFRLHFLSNLREELVKEKRPKRRLVIRDLVRLEWRNLYYSTDKPSSSTARLRNRIETLWPVNKQRITDNGASYLMADWEWFIPVMTRRSDMPTGSEFAPAWATATAAPGALKGSFSGIDREIRSTSLFTRPTTRSTSR